MKLLLIAGMGESIGLARDLCALPDVDVICVNEGRAVARAAPPAKTHEGGFASDDDFRAFLRAQQFDYVVDAAHPFQAGLGDVARNAGLPYLRVTRPHWVAQKGDDWAAASDIAAAVDAIPKGATVFAVTGRGTLDRFQNRPDLTVYCRQLEHHGRAFPLERGRYIFGAGPFAVDDEVVLFQMLGINALLVRNSGSVAGASKLAAARALGIKVIMIDPPSLQIDADQVTDVGDVVEKVRCFANN